MIFYKGDIFNDFLYRSYILDSTYANIYEDVYEIIANL